jgi:hypothetical protein
VNKKLEITYAIAIFCIAIVALELLLLYKIWL